MVKGKEVVKVKPKDIQQTSDDKVFTSISVRHALQLFLSDAQDGFCLEPHMLNPFLRCLEAIGEWATVRLEYINREPFYRVFRGVGNSAVVFDSRGVTVVTK